MFQLRKHFPDSRSNQITNFSLFVCVFIVQTVSKWSNAMNARSLNGDWFKTKCGKQELCLKNHKKSASQLFQDLFVLFIHNEKKNGSFLEFGATDGVELSNSYMLEKYFGWTGVLAETSPQWHSELSINRPNTNIITECIYAETGKQIFWRVHSIWCLLRTTRMTFQE